MVALGISNEHPDFGLETKFIIASSPCFIGIKPGNINLLHWTNVFVLQKMLNGKLNELSGKWLKTPLPTQPSL